MAQIYCFLDLLSLSMTALNSHFFVNLVGSPKKLHIAALKGYFGILARMPFIYFS